MEYFFLKIMDASRHGMLKNETFLQEFPLSQKNKDRSNHGYFKGKERTAGEALFKIL